MTSGDQRALIVFGKVPKPGSVKTRLVPPLDAAEAASLYEAFLLDALEAYASLPVAVRLYLNPAAGVYDHPEMPSSVTTHFQEGDDLGARMSRAFAETFTAGYEHAVIIGTDHPTLPPERVEEAFAGLEEPRTIVIGPAEDGGYYLLGMQEPIYGIFHEMTYSHGRVFAETMKRIEEEGQRAAVLPEWYDVDTPEDLMRLSRDLSKADARAPRTRAELHVLAARYDWLVPDSSSTLRITASSRRRRMR